MFENNEVNGIYYSRFIASWLRAGGNLRTRKDYNAFEAWLKSIKVPDEDVHRISYLAQNGKIELEDNAKNYIIASIKK